MPKHAVTGVDRIDDDAKAEHIDNGCERYALAAHFLVDAVEVLFATLHARVDAGFLDGGAEVVRDLADELLLIAARALERFLDDAVAARIQRLESQLFELGLHHVDAQTIGDRRVDLQRFAGDRAALGRGHRAERAHVVRAIGQLHHDHADIAHHGEQHLAEGFRLRFGAAAKLDLIELGDTVDQFGDFGTEAFGDFVLRRRGVFDHIVQDGSNDGLRVQVQVGEDVGDCHRMRNVGFAA